MPVTPRNRDNVSGLVDLPVGPGQDQCLACAVPLSLSPNASLFLQGEASARIFFIQSGLVRTLHVSPEGKELTLAYWPPGTVVGGPDILGETPNAWGARAVRATHVLAFNKSDIDRLIANVPDFARLLIRSLSQKVLEASGLVQALATSSVSERVARILVELVRRYGEPDGTAYRLVHPLTHEDLASMVGASRQWISHILHQFQTQGLVKIGYREIVVLQLQDLERYRPTVIPGHEDGFTP